MKYPIKNILLIFVAILLVGGAFVFAEYRNKQAKTVYESEKSVLIASKNEPLAIADDDTDGDGSKDWEEILVGTNPKDPKNKPDSRPNTAATADLTKKPNEKLDPVDLISREFFARYMELKQTGSSKDKISQEQLAQRTAGNIVLSQPGKYELKDILTKNDNSKDAVRLYGQQITNIFNKNSVKTRNEAVIAKESFEEEDPEILNEIDISIDSYKKIINSLLLVSVPESISRLHLELINSMNGALFVAKSLRNSSLNPIEGAQGVQYYSVVQKSLYDSMTAIKSYFKYLEIDEQVF